MIKLITMALLTITLTFTVSASEQCNEEAEKIIEMQEKNLNHGTVRRSTLMAYIRITVGSTGMVYALVNSATGVGLLSAIIFVGGSLDIYINSKNDDELDKLAGRLCK